jgi:hypothetical protein
MKFLYGDSTPSPLTSNFLEFLRDSLDFSVFALHVDEELTGIRERERATTHAADAEIARLEALGGDVAAAVDQADKGAADSETSRCAAHLGAASAELIAQSIASVRERLEGQRALIAAEEGAQRDACFRALETLLLPHSPPQSSVSLRIERGSRGGYTASRQGQTPFGLAWRIDLAVPAGHAFAGDSPMEKFAAHVEIHAPEQTGWLKKEVKLKAQRLDRFLLTEVVDDGAAVTFKLRTDASGAQGLDLEVDPDDKTVTASRAGAGTDPAAGAFELAPEDLAGLVGVAEKARAAASELTPTRLVEATFNEGDLRQEEAFAGFIEKLVTFMAPIVKDVSRHSLTPTELVLRRLLSSERREEIFVAKSTLSDKLVPLRPDVRRMFDVLGLDAMPRASHMPQPPPEAHDGDPPARAELPRSYPPPPLNPSRP